MIVQERAKSLGVVLLLIGLIPVLVSCIGVSQEAFDRVSKDLADAQERERQLSIDLGIIQSKIRDHEAELDNAEAKLEEYSKIVEASADFRLRADQARQIAEVYNEFWYYATRDDVPGIVGLLGKIGEIEDDETRAFFQTIISKGVSGTLTSKEDVETFVTILPRKIEGLLK